MKIGLIAFVLTIAQPILANDESGAKPLEQLLEAIKSLRAQVETLEKTVKDLRQEVKDLQHEEVSGNLARLEELLEESANDISDSAEADDLDVFRGFEAREEAAAAALKKIELPDSPTKADFRSYVNDLADICKSRRFILSGDLAAKKLTKLGHENLELIIEHAPEHSFYFKTAIAELAQDEDKDLVLEYLSDKTELISIVVEKGWIEDARSILLEKLESSTGFLPAEWIDAVTSLNDPETYPALLKYFENCFSPYSIYSSIRRLPGIQKQLAESVARSWKRKKFQIYLGVDTFSSIAVEFGHRDALAACMKTLRSENAWLRRETLQSLKRCTEARGSSRKILAWYEENKDRIRWDTKLRRWVLPDED